MKNKRRIRTTISILCSFFIMVLLVIVLAIGQIYFGAFYEQKILEQVDESDIYEQGYEEFISRIHYAMEGADIPLENITNVVSLKRYYINERDYIRNALNGEKTDLHLEELSQELNQSLDNYLIENKIIKTANLDLGIEEITGRLMNEYKGNIEFSFVQDIYKYKKIFEKTALWLAPLILFGIVAFVHILIKIHRYKHRSLRYLSYSCLGAMVLMGMLYLWIRQGLSLDSFIQGAKYYQDFIRAYISNIKQTFLYGVGALALLYIALLTSIYSLKQRL